MHFTQVDQSGQRPKCQNLHSVPFSLLSLKTRTDGSLYTEACGYFCPSCGQVFKLTGISTLAKLAKTNPAKAVMSAIEKRSPATKSLAAKTSSR